MNTKKSIFWKKTLVAFIIFLLINLCSLPLAQAFGFKSKKPQADNLTYKLNYVNIDWWQNFNDPYLQNYIVQAVKNNQDLKIATLKVEEYRQYVKEQFGYELPEASVVTDYIGLKTPFNATVDAFNLSKSAYTLPFTVKYEADFLAKNRDKTKSAQKLCDAQKFQEKTAYIAICANVATVYINILKADKQICIQNDLVAVRKEQLARIEKKHSRGLATTMQVNDYKKSYQTALNDLDTLQKNRDVMLDELAVLIGESPANARCLKRGSLDCFEFCGVVPECISSDVIFSRPDVLSSEEQLKSAKLDIRVARKEFFPRFNIYGTLGFNTISPSPFWSWNGSFALLLAGATQDIFYGGRKLANLRIKKNKYDQLFENYKQINLKAVQEVNDSLYAVKYDTDVEKTTQNKLCLERVNFERAHKKYNQGVISCPDLLSEKEKLIALESEKTNSKAMRLVNYLSLYKAAGGKI
jgi:NodT family efflux transporter outer membrane factor (OMF) lipoprotein